MGGQAIDEVGHRYGRLVITERAVNKEKKAAWICECACGNRVTVRGCSLRNGNTQSCGCYNREIVSRTYLKNEVGHQYGKLTVLNQIGMKHGEALWLCYCECGTKTEVVGSHLRSGHTQSCGCSRGKKLPFGEAAFNQLVCHMKVQARQRGFIWSLTGEQVRQLTSESCSYCGAAPYQRKGSPLYNGDYLYNGLDRVANDKGYTLDNVVPCCGTCNLAKRTMTQDEFLTWISQVYEYSVSKEK